MTTHPQELAERIEQSARRLFGTTELATQLALEADRYQRDAAAILTRRGVKRATLAFTGPTGHGKTSLLRMLVRSEETRERLAAGVRGADRTAQVVWVGPQRPDDLDPKHEAHVLCRGDELEDLGRPVALVDTPGFSNRHGSLARIAVDALTDADLHVLVVRRDQIERADVLQHGEHAVGALVLPVVRTRDLDEPTLASEVDAFYTALSEAGGTVLRPVVVPDADVHGADGWSVVRDRVVPALRSALASLPDPEAQVTARLDVRTRRLRRRVATVLAPVASRVQGALDELEAEVHRIPTDVVGRLLGSDRVLEAGVHGRLRAELADTTWAMWFPYRPVLGLVQLTYGAWDRLLLGVGGSLPSWFGTLFAAGRRLRDAASFETAVASLQERLTATSVDRLGPLLARFERALAAAAGGTASDPRGSAVRLEGVTQLQESSAQIVTDVVAKHAVSGWVANGWGLVSTVLFWVLFSGPLVALYQHYLGAGYGVFAGTPRLEDFPTPTLSFWMTSLALSLAPVFLTTVLFVTTLLSRRRLVRAATEVRDTHHERIAELRDDGVLRLHISDERLADARFLLTLGRASD